MVESECQKLYKRDPTQLDVPFWEYLQADFNELSEDQSATLCRALGRDPETGDVVSRETGKVRDNAHCGEQAGDNGEEVR